MTGDTTHCVETIAEELDPNFKRPAEVPGAKETEEPPQDKLELVTLRGEDPIFDKDILVGPLSKDQQSGMPFILQ